MRKIIAFIIFLISIFVINLIFYFVSDDYRFFLKKIKDTDEIVYLEEKTYNDSLEKNVLENAEVVKLSTENEKIFELKESTWAIFLKNEITLWRNYKDIINLFSIYK